MIERGYGEPAPAAAPALATPTAAPSPTGAAGTLQRLQGSAGNAAVVALLRRQTATGRPLPAELRRRTELESGLDLADTRVHHDSPVPGVLGAEAFAHGSDIHLGPGQEQHLPHEAWHVVQQRQGRVRRSTSIAGLPVSTDAALEAEADRGDGPAMAGRAAPAVVQGVFVMAPGSTAFVPLVEDTDTHEIFQVESSSGATAVLQGVGIHSAVRITVDIVGGQFVRRPGPEPAPAPGPVGFGSGPASGSDVPVTEEFAPEDMATTDEGPTPDYSAMAEEQLSEDGMRPARLESDFLAQVEVLPTTDGTVGSDGHRRYAGSEVFVSRISVSNDRPPTYLEPRPGKSAIPQGKHTVAFALVRRAMAGMAGCTAEELVGRIVGEAQHAAKFLGTGEGAFMLRAIGPAAPDPMVILNGIFQTLAPGPFPIENWQRLLSQIVKYSVDLHHLSAMATVTGVSKGRGEGSALEVLSGLHETLATGQDLDEAEVEEAAAAALQLLEVTQGMPMEAYGAAVHEWINKLKQAFPLLMALHEEEVVAAALDKPLGKRYASEHGPGTVADLLTGMSSLPPSKASSSSAPPPPTSGPSAVAPFALFPGLERGSFLANVVLFAPPEDGSRVGATVGATGLVQADCPDPATVEIGDLAVSDVRPPTRFGTAQMSHTMAWTLLRAELLSFRHRSLNDLLAYLVTELNHLRAEVRTGIVEHALGELTAAAGRPRPVYLWQRDVSLAVQWYVYAHQLAPSTTYADPRTMGAALGHGEGTHMDTLRRAEAALVPPTDGGASSSPLPEGDVIAAASAMLDLSASELPARVQAAFERWRRAFVRTFPNISARHGAAIETAILDSNIGTSTAPVRLRDHLAAARVRLRLGVGDAVGDGLSG